ncbi:MAG: hypothetical protein ACRCYU_12530 [Nocardioides sp.]
MIEQLTARAENTEAELARTRAALDLVGKAHATRSSMRAMAADITGVRINPSASLRAPESVRKPTSFSSQPERTALRSATSSRPFAIPVPAAWATHEMIIS